MAFCEDGPYGKLAQQRARANIILERLSACVFAVSGVSAAWFGRWILAAGFATVASILVCISIFASIKFRKNYLVPPLGTMGCKPRTAPITQKRKPSLLAWVGIMLVTSGIAGAAIFFFPAAQSVENKTPYELLGISCLVQALIGVILITHTRRKPPELRGESDVGFRPGLE